MEHIGHKIRGHRIAMIFQDPMTSLNPFLRTGRQISEVIEELQVLLKIRTLKEYKYVDESSNQYEPISVYRLSTLFYFK